MQPEIPFLAAGAVAITGGAIAEKHWPASAARSVVGTIALVIGASATANTRFAPLVHAIGILLLIASVMAAVKTVNDKKKGKK